MAALRAKIAQTKELIAAYQAMSEQQN